FEGTYSHTFSGNQNPTPRYDYNQLMYRLDLADPRLALPQAVADPPAAPAAVFSPPEARRLAFFAPDPARTSTVRVFAERDKGKLVRLRLKAEKGEKPAFHALPAGKELPGTVPLVEWVDGAGGRRYVAGERPLPGWQRARVLCRVWPNPWAGGA